MPHYPKLRERPPNFRLNTGSPLYRGMVFAGLGQHYGSRYYQDESPLKNHGTLTGFSGSGDTPAAKWQWDAYLRRWVLGFDGVDDYVSCGTAAGHALTDNYTVALWINNSNWNGYHGFLTHLQSGVGGWGIVAAGGALSWVARTASDYSYLFADANPVGWASVVGRVQNGQRTLWINGKRQSTSDSFVGAAAPGAQTVLGLYYGDLTFFAPGVGQTTDGLILRRPCPPSEIAALADPGNVDLRVGGVPLILPVRRHWPVKSPVVPVAMEACVVAAGAVFVTGRQAGHIHSSGPAAGQAFAAGAIVGQIYG